MNKKVKISLLSLMLGASLVGIATTIVSCSASSSNEIKIEKSSTLEKDITDDLTEIFSREDDYLAKRKTYINIVKVEGNGKLPESTLTILKNGITFKNDGNTISWDDAVSGLKIEGPQFIQVANGQISGISIELIINPNYVVLGASLENIKIKTGALGNVGSIPIHKLTEQTPDFDEKISSMLTDILNQKRTYQEMKATYDSWVEDAWENLPNSILTEFNKNFRFDLLDGSTLSFRNIVDNLIFEPLTTYPTGVDQKIPNFKITIVLISEDDYIFTNPSEKEQLKIQNININANTKPIDSTLGSVNDKNIESALINYLNQPNEDNVLVYQEVRQRFNDLTSENATIPNEIKNAILENVKLNFPDYQNPPSKLDDVIDTIKISSTGNFPSTANSPLPNVTINLTLKPDFLNLDSSIKRPINIDLSKSKSGIIKYDVEVDPNLSKNFSNELYKFLKNPTNAFTWQGMKRIYDSWDSFDKLPESAKQLLKNGITFTPSLVKGENNNLDIIVKSNSFDNIIDSISLSKKEGFPVYGEQIGSIDLELTMIDDAFYSKEEKYQRKIEFKSGSIGEVNSPVLISIEPIAANVNAINSKIQELISKDKWTDSKKAYDGLENINDLGPEIVQLITKSINVKASSYPKEITWDDIVDKSKTPTVIKGEFPNEPNMPINNFSIRVNLNEKYILNNSEKSFVINFGTLQSKGNLEIEAKLKNNASQSFEDFFTNYLDTYIVSGIPSTTPENRILFMQQRYNSIPTSNSVKNKFMTDVLFTNKITGKNIDVSGSKFDKYFKISSEVGTPPTDINEKFPPVTITITLTNESNFLWSGDKLTLKITTKPLKSAVENKPSIY